MLLSSGPLTRSPIAYRIVIVEDLLPQYHATLRLLRDELVLYDALPALKVHVLKSRQIALDTVLLRVVRNFCVILPGVRLN